MFDTLMETVFHKEETVLKRYWFQIRAYLPLQQVSMHDSISFLIMPEKIEREYAVDVEEGMTR
jgi:hypothetical protein